MDTIRPTGGEADPLPRVRIAPRPAEYPVSA
jgi:hypothetical protein